VIRAFSLILCSQRRETALQALDSPFGALAGEVMPPAKYGIRDARARAAKRLTRTLTASRATPGIVSP
jgi:hypothetical protein